MKGRSAKERGPFTTSNAKDRITPRVISATNFSAELRQKIGVEPTAPLSDADMLRIIRKYPQITPVALFNPGSHWNLVIKVPPYGIEIFDPINGVRTIGVFRPSDVTYYTSEKGTFNSQGALDEIKKDGYFLSSGPLRRLGIAQTDPANCVDLSIYAAGVAKGLITPTL